MKNHLIACALTACTQTQDDSIPNNQSWNSFESPGEPLDEHWIEPYGIDPAIKDGLIYDYFRINGFDNSDQDEKILFFADVSACVKSAEGPVLCKKAPEYFELEFNNNKYTSNFAIHVPLFDSGTQFALIYNSEGIQKCIPIYAPDHNDYCLELTYLKDEALDVRRTFSMAL